MARDLAVRYAARRWEKTYPTAQKRRAFLAAERARIEKGYTRAWQIFFNTFQKVNQQADPARVEASARGN